MFTSEFAQGMGRLRKEARTNHGSTESQFQDFSVLQDVMDRQAYC